MPLLGFTVFKAEILSGEKRQTIRRVRKYPVKVGDRLYLYWHLRRKDCVKLGEAVCSETFLVELFYSPPFNAGSVLRSDSLTGKNARNLTPIEIEDLAKRDGFTSASEMIGWFQNHYPRLDDLTFQVIRW